MHEDERRSAYKEEGEDEVEEDVIEADIKDAEDLGNEWTAAKSRGSFTFGLENGLMPFSFLAQPE
jgi:hypothetical protein